MQKAPIAFRAHSLTLMHTQLVFLLIPSGNGFKVLVFVTYAALISIAHRYSAGQSHAHTHPLPSLISILFTVLLCALAALFLSLSLSAFKGEELCGVGRGKKSEIRPGSQ